LDTIQILYERISRNEIVIARVRQRDGPLAHIVCIELLGVGRSASLRNTEKKDVSTMLSVKPGAGCRLVVDGNDDAIALFSPPVATHDCHKERNEEKAGRKAHGENKWALHDSASGAARTVCPHP